MAGHLNKDDEIKQWDADLLRRRFKVPEIRRSELAIAAEQAERVRPGHKIFILYKLETRAQRAARAKEDEDNLNSDN